MIACLATFLTAAALGTPGVTTNPPTPAAAVLGVPAPATAVTTNPPATAEPAVGFALPSAAAPGPEATVEAAYRRLLELDDAAQEEMDRWIREADSRGVGADQDVLKKRIQERVDSLDAAYREFLAGQPGHVAARVAFGSFLNDTGREGEARAEWERALKLDPKDPAIYNNLAGSYGHSGPVTNAFTFYEKAIELDPREPVYHQNFATTLALFRRDVMEHYRLENEQQVFDMALEHYRKALELEPGSFLIATDLAQTFYLIKPPRHDDALAAWRKAYDLAADDLEREGIRVHLARIQVQAGRFAEARTNLAAVTNGNYTVIKERIAKNLESREADAAAKGPAKP